MSTDESFIPWSMIEPLLEEGMTAQGLAIRLVATLGLERWTYQFRLVKDTGRFAESLHHGVTIEKGQGIDCNDEPVR